MVWGGFAAKGTTDLAVISTRLDSVGYTELLQNNLLTCARKIGSRNWIFQQDNAAIHTARVVNDFLRILLNIAINY